MGFTSDLLAGVAQLLEDAGVGRWEPSGQYPPGDAPPIFILSQPSAPDVAITLTSYGVSDAVEQADSVVGVQVRTRGTTDPRAVTDLDDAVFGTLHGASNLTLATGVLVLLIERRSSTSLGWDANRRHERSSNFYLTLTRPSGHRS